MKRQEQETIISRTAADNVWHIWTCIPQDIRRMDASEAFTAVSRKTYNDGSEAVTYTVPVAEWNPVTGRKRKRTLTDEQRQAAADRMKAITNRD